MVKVLYCMKWNNLTSQNFMTPNYIFCVVVWTLIFETIQMEPNYIAVNFIFNVLSWTSILFYSEINLRQPEDSGLKGLGGLSPRAETCRMNVDQREAVPTGTGLQQLNNNSNAKPSVEETVNMIINRLKERRRELGLPDSIKVVIAEVFPPLKKDYRLMKAWRWDSPGWKCVLGNI